MLRNRDLLSNNEFQKISDCIERQISRYSENSRNLNKLSLSGFINTTNKDVIALLKADKEDLPAMIDELRGIKKKEDEEKTHSIEDSVADVSMVGNANMFISGMNNYLSRFPKLRLDPTYIPRTLSVIEAVRNYLNEVEKDILNALAESNENMDTPQSEQEL